ncbi:hypothetical protein D0U04_21755 [Bacillus clarus]|uniref:Uncharacterized protein n=1 Tax=Bacillus clarus TaxID=2338372 RepID=A0A090Y7V3_9BACI|nr:hypothetical protein [Bacillus clarus]KFM94853.1 hypothetical protein DJ93_5985 [Bacillus clarus]RFT64508.1 hypothetical protein D0U04_21755 [Bacillus clarus]
MKSEPKKVGFLKFVTSRKRVYVYLAKEIYIEKLNKRSVSKTQILYRFGNFDVALEKMFRWRENPEKEFPEEILKLGYNLDDLDDWIMTLETGYSKTGRKLTLYN